MQLCVQFKTVALFGNSWYREISTFVQLSVQIKTVALFENFWYREISAFVQLFVQFKTVALFGNSFGTGKLLLLCSSVCNLRQ